MKAVFLSALLLAGCSSFDSDDFCVLFVKDQGVVRCAAWELKPSKAQDAEFNRGRM